MNSTGSKKVITAAIFAGMVYLSSISALHGSLLKYIIPHYQLSSSGQGLASLSASLGGMAAFIITLLLIGRVKKTHLLCIGFALDAVFLCLMSVLPPYPLFILVWFLAGIGMGFMDALLSSCIADLYIGKAATRMMCNMHCVFGVASMAMPLAYSFLLSRGLLWNRIYLLLAVFGVLLCVFMILSEKVSGMAQSVADERGLSFSDFICTLRSGSLIFYILGMLFHGFFLGGLNTWSNYYVGECLSGSLGNAALSFLFSGVLISRFLMPYTGIDPSVYIRYAGFGAAILLFAGLPFSGGFVFCICLALSSFCFGAMIPCMLNVACAENSQNTLMTTSLMMLALYLGQGIASPVLGLCEATVGLRFGIGLCALFMALASLTFCLRRK